MSSTEVSIPSEVQAALDIVKRGCDELIVEAEFVKSWLVASLLVRRCVLN